MESQIFFLYAKGISMWEIVATFKAIYDAEVSPTLIYLKSPTRSKSRSLSGKIVLWMRCIPLFMLTA
ncbi:transposase [Erwinia sp. Ejp617]|nr:transposase [Erwinia sp. Ejp617]